jgi:Tfp pilus assembly protein PilN
VSTPAPRRIVEWSPNEVVGFDPATRTFSKATDLVQLAMTFGGGPVVAAVSRRSTFVKSVRVPNAGVAEVDMILQTQMATMFPVPLSELAYAFRMTHDVNAEGRLAVVAAMRESDLRNLEADAKAAGMKLETVVPAALGSMALAETLGEHDLAVVQDTSEGLAIDLLAGGELRYSRVTPMPANHGLLESEIARSFQAVGLARFSVLAAGGFAYPDAEKKDPTPTLEALASAPLDRIGVHLETREERDRHARSAQMKRTRIAVLMCAAATLLALLVFVEWQEAAEKNRIANGKWALTLKKLREREKKLSDEVVKLRATESTLLRAFNPAQTPAEVLTTLSNRTPQGLWLTGVTFDRGKIMYLRGTASNSAAVTQFLQSLTTEPRLRDVKLVFANNGEIDKVPVVQFSIQAFPIGNLPLLDPKKKGART